MCGICGWFNRTGNIDNKILEKMNNIAKHRGPDDEGYVMIKNDGIDSYSGDDSIPLDYPHIGTCDEKYRLAFAHRRLSIIDLSASGHQPMQIDDGKLCITFNGEIYNYIEIKEELETKGYKFVSSSDTEVLLYAYKEWGEDCVTHLNGMWGFAIWDAYNRKIFCSRDRLGAKPFHYYIDRENFIFGSELKQVSINPVVPKKINERILSAVLFFSITDFSDETLIKDIKELRGGYNLSYRLQEDTDKEPEISVYRYWDVDVNACQSDDFISETLKMHESAVDLRLRSDVPIGLMLSGGLDSSVLTAEVSSIMKERGIAPETINTYTTCYNNYKEGDEKEFAHKVNEYCKTKENLIYPDDDDTFAAYKDMIWHTENIDRYDIMGAYLTLREVSKFGNKVIINGQGSDETMFGYEKYYVWYLRQVLKTKGISAFFSETKKVTHNSRLGYSGLLLHILYFGNIRIRRARCRRRMKPYVTKSLLHVFDDDKKVEDEISYKSYEDMRYHEIRGAHLTNILRLDDRMYMAFSMESRVPFIDYRYIESVVKIPDECKIRNGYTKYILREYIKDKLPEEVVWRKNKMGWPSPREYWLDRFNKEEIEALFVNSRSGKYFKIDKMKELWKNDLRSYALERFVGVELFMRMFDVVA